MMVSNTTNEKPGAASAPAPEARPSGQGISTELNRMDEAFYDAESVLANLVEELPGAIATGKSLGIDVEAYLNDLRIAQRRIRVQLREALGTDYKTDAHGNEVR